jgi:predicted anti-sigma-YlaC factor YlaD
MDCLQVQWMLSAFLDGRIVESEKRLLEEHLESCVACDARYRNMAAVQTALRAVPVRKVNRQLALSLRSMASHEAARRRRRVDLRARVHDVTERVTFWASGLMKPLALPAAGGLAAAVLLFMAVMTNFQGIISVPQPGDIPTVLATEAQLKSTLLDTAPEEINVDVLVDEQGRVIDYSLPKGLDLAARQELKREIGNSLLFSQFHPKTTFGQPTVGWVRVTFRRTQLEVRG